MELDTRTKAYIQAIIAQRNNAMDTVAQFASEIAGLQEELGKQPVVTPSIPVVAPVPSSPAPAAGADFFDWAAAGFKPQMVVPGYGNPLTGTGDKGCSFRFIADATTYPKGVVFSLTTGSVTVGPEDYVISPNPYDYTNIVPGSLCQGVGSSGNLGARFGTGTVYSQNDCNLQPGGVYYINCRCYVDPANPQPRGTAIAELQFTPRTD